jgi:hypothetical protein
MKINNIIFFAFLFYLLGISTLAAKEVSKISGKILDQKGEVVAYANVALIDISGGGLVDGAVSNEFGEFLIETVKTGEVKLLISSIGFQSFESAAFELTSGLIKDMGVLNIVDEMTGLGEVTVRSTRPEIILAPDKTIINVEGTAMAE